MNTRLYTGTAAKKIDQIAIQDFGINGFDLMNKAGETAFSIISQRMTGKTDSTPMMVVFCGSGNNGGDGYIIGRCAEQVGWDVALIQAGQPNTKDAKAAHKQFLDAGGKVSTLESCGELQAADVVVDALLGVGISGPLRKPVSELTVLANQIDAFKVAIDVPTGVDADTGSAQPGSFTADLTISFIVNKVGLLTGAATNFVGQLLIDDLAIAGHIIERVEHSAYLIENVKSLASPLQRHSDSHKGHYGHAIIAGGDQGMFGAVLLASRAALRSGSGKVTVVSTKTHTDFPALDTPELMSKAFEKDMQSPLPQGNVIVLGPGLGLFEWGEQLFDAAIRDSKPMVIDADALTLLARREDKLKNPNWVLTPHPGEAARLLGCHTRDVQNDRVSAVQEISDTYGCVCVLKGAGTLVAGGGETIGVCNLGNPGMASAGMGDVLSGVIGAFISQGLSLRDASELGVWLHASCADQWIKDKSKLSLIASDIIEQIPSSLGHIIESL